MRADVQQYATAADQWAALPNTMDEESLRELEAQDAEEVKEVVEALVDSVEFDAERERLGLKPMKPYFTGYLKPFRGRKRRVGLPDGTPLAAKSDDDTSDSESDA